VAFFRSMAAGELPSIVSEGGDGAERTQFICGFLGCDLRPFNPVLDALPAMIHLRTAARSTDRLVLRLAELMFVEVVRCHLETMAGAKAGWLAGLHDPLVARTLSLLHGAPARHWTLEELAVQAGSSRSVLAERFAQFVGQPPMQYLTQWRMQLATRLLAGPGARKVIEVAEAVGYESEAAFSRAFKRCVGMAPGAWRLRNDA
jgi:AraC-like DNA-binding protein